MSDDHAPLIRQALQDIHADHAPPEFETLWADARRDLERTAAPAPARRPRVRLRSAAALAAGCAALTLLAVPLGRDADVPASSLDVRETPASAARGPAFDAEMTAALRAHALYARTDALLPARTLLLAAQPAYYVTYDPINLEVIP